MSISTTSNARSRPDDVIESLTTILSSLDAEIVFVTCIDGHGFVRDSEAYASHEQPKSALPLEHLFAFPRELELDTIMVTSRATESLDAVSEADLEFTRALIDAASAENIEVFDHVLVRDGNYRCMREITDLWP